MADLAELQTRLETLRATRAGGTAEVSYNGETIKYRSDAELAAAIRDLERQIAGLSRQPVRRILVGTTKGF